jgi:purine-nucleoside phosphorylase
VVISDKWDELGGKCAARIVSAFKMRSAAALPKVAMVLGSGFDPEALGFEVRRGIPFRKLPGFPAAGVEGHAGELLLASLEGLPFLLCHGRAHFYEGHEMAAVMFPVRVLARLGVEEVVLTNAAGGINAKFRPGDFMMVSDHINFTGVNPLRGLPALTGFAGRARAAGACFVDLSEAYSRRLRKHLRAAAARARVRLHEGIYLGVGGPSYETPAEIRAFRKLGADAVGMSTIPEVLMARSLGLEVAAISCITNRAAGMDRRKLSHEEVLETGLKSAGAAAALFGEFARARHRRGTLNRQKANKNGAKARSGREIS